jgi:hypothetical protein
MFQDYSLEVVEFPSSWKKEKSSADAHTQTSEVLANETETQTSRPSSVAVQTEPEPGRPPVVVVDNSAVCTDVPLPSLSLASSRSTAAHSL